MSKIYFLHKQKFIIKKSLPLIIGFFDGIHNGHINLFKKAGAQFNVLTFTNVPSKNKTLFFNSDRIANIATLTKAPQNIYVYDVKKNNDAVFFIKVLQKRIKPSKIIVGNGFKFGPGRTKSINELKKYFNVIPVKENVVKSSLIKKYIGDGDITKANKLLITPYHVSGEIIHGNKNGTKLGFKTANIKLDDSLITVKPGSYLAYSIVDQNVYPSAVFFRNGVFESHILNGFNKNIYGKKIIIYPVLFTKPIHKVNGFNNLKTMIANKVREIEKMFSKL